MIVTKLEPLTKTKYKIELDGEITFVLYKKEVSRFSVCEAADLDQETYQRIKNEVLIKRAKLRAMHLLNAMDRTEAGLREKLRQSLYPEEVIEQAIDYVKKFGYIDDYRYALHFIETRNRSKSRKEIWALLAQKGIEPEQMELAFEEAYAQEGDQAAILKILEKKRFEEVMDNPKELQKIYGYLARKGFCYEDIRQVIQNYTVNA